MRRVHAAAIAVCALASAACAGTAPEGDIQAELERLERGALDRWGNGDPGGFLEVYAPEITYFDPQIERRIDGLDSMRAYLEPIRGLVNIERYEIVGAKVQRFGDAALLSYNLVSHARAPDGEPVEVRWNSSVLYARSGGEWRSVHSHWSHTRPNVGPPPTG
jgi:ketosteroid isomerase-like protein